MGTNLVPFRVAFWALLVAFGLSLVVSVSDPQLVRMTILAQRQPKSPAALSEAVLVAETSPPSVPLREHARSTPTAAPEASTTPRQPALAAADLSFPRDAIEHASEQERQVERDWSDVLRAPALNGFPTAARTVSSPSDRYQASTDAAMVVREGSMPVLTPTHLQRPVARGEFYELPTPPEWSDDPAPFPRDPAEGQASREELHGPALSDTSTLNSFQHAAVERAVQQRLETEIVNLRREIDRLAESQEIGRQLDQLQRQQQQLLRLHQELPIARLLHLVDLLNAQLQEVRETIPKAPANTRVPVPVDEASLEGETSRHQDGRLSLRITEARLDDILLMLSRLSGTPIIEEREPKNVNMTRTDDDLIRSVEALEWVSPAPLAPAESLPVPPSIAPGPAASQPAPEFPQAPRSLQQHQEQTASSSQCAACHRQQGIR